MTTAQELFTPVQVAERYGVAPHTLACWRSASTGPTYVKLGKKVFYRASDLAAFEAAHAITTATMGTAQPAVRGKRRRSAA